MKYWFVSYVYKYEPLSSPMHFGSAIIHSDIHPCAKLKLWSKSHGRTYVLLSYCEVSEEDAKAIGDCDMEI